MAPESFTLDKENESCKMKAYTDAGMYASLHRWDLMMHAWWGQKAWERDASFAVTTIRLCIWHDAWHEVRHSRLPSVISPVISLVCLRVCHRYEYFPQQIMRIISNSAHMHRLLIQTCDMSCHSSVWRNCVTPTRIRTHKSECRPAYFVDKSTAKMRYKMYAMHSLWVTGACILQYGARN